MYLIPGAGQASHLGALFRHAIDLNWLTLESSPFYKTRLLIGVKNKKTLSQVQLDIIDAVMNRFQREEEKGILDWRGCSLYPVWYWKIVLALFRTTGLRRNQLLYIRLNDFDHINKTLQFRECGSKTHREWKVPILNFIAYQLEVLSLKAIELKAKPNDFLFDMHRYKRNETTENKVLSSNPLSSFFKRLSQECGFNVSSHRFRHTLATNLMKTPNRNILIVQELLGHSNISTTREYVSMDINALRKTLEDELSTDKFVRDNTKNFSSIP